jgi:nicotinamidase-related amidase
VTVDTEPHWEASALLTIDMQVHFLSASPYGIAGTTEILPNLHRITDAFREALRPIVHMVRIYLPDGSNADIARRAMLSGGAVVVRPGTEGVELAPGLATGGAPLNPELLLRGDLQRLAPREVVLYKPRWNAFFGTDLMHWLREQNIDTVVVAGCNYPNCPRGTLFGASERDVRAVAVVDALSGWTSSAAQELLGIGVHSVTTAFAIEELRSLRAVDRDPGRGHDFPR